MRKYIIKINGINLEAFTRMKRIGIISEIPDLLLFINDYILGI